MCHVLILGVLLTSACGSPDPGAPPAGSAESRTDVGKVIEVSGTVTATFDGTARTLAAGNPIRAADVIDTGKDGSITIELFHNHARWSLESGIRTRVDESVAWTMSKQKLAEQAPHDSGHGSAKPLAPGELPDKPDRDGVASTMTVLEAKIRACPANGKKAMVKITIKVGPDGTVARTDVKQSLDPAIDACAIDAVKTGTFPRSNQGLIFSYPFVFK